MRVNSERGRDVAVTEHFLHRLHVRSVPHEEARQAVTQVVEPETYLLAFLKHSRLDCSPWGYPDFSLKQELSIRQIEFLQERSESRIVAQALQ